MRLYELQMPDTRQDATDRLEEAGYEQLGKGSFANVFRKPGAPYVLKLFDVADRGYKAFVNAAIKSNNPHFPKFVKGMVRINDKYVAIRMEPLKPASSEARINFQLVDRYIGGDITDDEIQMLEDIYGPAFTDALSIVMELIGSDSSFSEDFHNDNIMFRGSVPVITDPIYTFRS